MMSYPLTAEARHHFFARILMIAAGILVLIIMSATAVDARVSKADSGAAVTPMSSAEYAKIKAQIRQTQPEKSQARYHITVRPELNHWKSGASSGWQSPWPK